MPDTAARTGSSDCSVRPRGTSPGCGRAGVPQEVGFATKPEMARMMIERVVRARLPVGWVAADEAYGDNPGLRRWLEGEGIRYVMAVSCDHMDSAPGRSQNRSTTPDTAATPDRSWTKPC